MPSSWELLKRNNAYPHPPTNNTLLGVRRCKFCGRLRVSPARERISRNWSKRITTVATRWCRSWARYCYVPKGHLGSEASRERAGRDSQSGLYFPCPSRTKFGKVRGVMIIFHRTLISYHHRRRASHEVGRFFWKIWFGDPTGHCRITALCFRTLRQVDASWCHTHT